MTALLETVGLSKSFPLDRNLLGRVTHHVQAVNHVSISLDVGETLAVVGESGSGKSTLGRLMLRLIEPDAGSIRFQDVDLATLGRSEMQVKRQEMQMIFQDPFSSLDPRMVIGEQIAEPLKVHHLVKGRDERRARVMDLLQQVGLREHQFDRFPYEFSGGQLQRIAIARALTTDPKLIVCDEPVAALDMSIRAQVINLLHDLQDSRGIALLFISHDLSLVRMIAHRVAVMYKGEIVETGPTAQIFEDPQHAYTKTLLSSIPVLDPRHRMLLA